MWRTTGFLMSFAVIIECATLVAYLTVIWGGKQSREKGWKVVCTLLGCCVFVQCVSMALVVGSRHGQVASLPRTNRLTVPDPGIPLEQ
jgi:formate hydrogenlyase subunit 3/multisubunit Na+/H+ antiporter MnhD subunit